MYKMGKNILKLSSKQDFFPQRRSVFSTKTETKQDLFPRPKTGSPDNVFKLKEILNDIELAAKFDRFRKIRNSINYYGKELELDEGIEIN